MSSSASRRKFSISWITLYMHCFPKVMYTQNAPEVDENPMCAFDEEKHFAGDDDKADVVL